MPLLLSVSTSLNAAEVEYIWFWSCYALRFSAAPWKHTKSKKMGLEQTSRLRLPNSYSSFLSSQLICDVAFTKRVCWRDIPRWVQFQTDAINFKIRGTLLSGLNVDSSVPCSRTTVFPDWCNTWALRGLGAGGWVLRQCYHSGPNSEWLAQGLWPVSRSCHTNSIQHNPPWYRLAIGLYWAILGHHSVRLGIIYTRTRCRLRICRAGKQGRKMNTDTDRQADRQPARQAGRDTYIQTNIHTYIRTYVRTYVHTYIHTFIHSFIYSYIHLFIHSFFHSFIHLFIHSSIYEYNVPWAVFWGEISTTSRKMLSDGPSP